MASTSSNKIFSANLSTSQPPLLHTIVRLRKLQRQHSVVFAAAFTQNSNLKLAQTHPQEDPPTLQPSFLSPSSASSSLIAGMQLEGSAGSASLDLAFFFRNPERITTAHEALEALITGHNRTPLSEREAWLARTLKERRGIVQELLMDTLKRARMRPTFSKNVVDCMPEFVDHIMIKAAALKKIPEHVNAPFSYRARLYIEQSQVAQTIRWLKHHKFTPFKIGKLVFMVEDYEGNLQPKIKWLKSINVHGRDLGAALMRDPRILEKTIEELNENVELLKNAGVRVDWIGWVVRRCSKVLACCTEELQLRIAFYSHLGIEGDNFGRMVYNFPASLGHFPLDEMYSKLEYLKGFGLDDASLGHALASKPQLIACSIEEDWKPLVKLFYFLGVDGYGLRRILIIKPSVFCLNLGNNIAPKIRFLRDVGVREEAIGDVLVKFPAFLTYSLDLKIRPFVMFLLEKAAVPIGKVGKVLSLQPDLLSCSLPKKLEIVVEFFLFHGFQRQQLGLMVADFPVLLKYSLSSLKPKLSFALRVMKLPLVEVVNFPRLFSYSLELKIAPRYKILKKRGLNFNLRKMLACTDEEFMKSLDASCTNTTEGKKELAQAEVTLEARWPDVSDAINSEDRDGVFARGIISETSWHASAAIDTDVLSEASWLDARENSEFTSQTSC